MILGFGRNAVKLTILVTLGALSACAQENPQDDPNSVAARQTLFQNGQADMSCGLGCSMEYGSARGSLKVYYESKDWTDLSNKLLSVGYGSDQSWFYLGRAAEGMGYAQAAKIYFLKSLDTKYTCKNFLSDVCDGIDVPLLAQSELDNVDNKLANQSRPAVGQAPTPSVSTAAINSQAGSDINESTPQSAPPSDQSNDAAENDVQLVSDDGTFEVPALINGVIPLNFTVDSGASDVSIPADVALTLIRTGTLQTSDFLGTQSYTLADGSTVPSTTFMIRSLKVGSQVITNVEASISDVNGPLLLGQSFLSRFTSWSIDNSRQVLILK